MVRLKKTANDRTVESKMKTFKVRHRTVYRYRQPVHFGRHRLMFRPRDSNALRLLETRLTISPPAQVRWVHDVFGNSFAFATIQDQAVELRFDSEILLDKENGNANPGGNAHPR